MTVADTIDFSAFPVPNGFELNHAGVFAVADGDPKAPKRRITTVPAWVSSMTRGLTGESWSIQLTWRDHDGGTKSEILDYTALLTRSGNLEALASSGLLILPGFVLQFSTYLSLAAAQPGVPRFRTYHSLGLVAWRRNGIDGVLHFVLPDRCLVPASVKADDEEMEEVQYRPHFQNKAASGYKASGSLEEWQEMVMPHAGNDLMVFALCFAFSSLLVGAAGMDIVIVHLFGQSSTGKTAALQMAMSVLGMAGDPQYPEGSNIERWNSTTNGIELLLAAHSGMLAAVDELGCNGEAMMSVYNATSGKGKIRMTDTGRRREQLEWMLGIMSSGEISMQEKIETSNKRQAKTGEIIRALDIPVGSLTNDNGLMQTEQGTLIRELKRQCGMTYGTAGPAFMQAVLDHFVTDVELRNWLVSEIDAKHAELIDIAERRRKLDPAHARALRRFAFIAVAGHLASQTNVLPLPEEVVERAVAAVANAWMEALPLLSEGELAVESMRNYVTSNHAQILHYDSWVEFGAPDNSVPRDQKAIRKGDLFLFNKRQFELACGGASPRIALAHMRDSGLLRREPDKMTLRIDMKALDIHRVAFYAVIAGRLQTDHDLRLVQKEEAAVLDSDDTPLEELEDTVPQRYFNGLAGPRPKPALVKRDDGPRRVYPGDIDDFSAFG